MPSIQVCSTTRIVWYHATLKAVRYFSQSYKSASYGLLYQSTVSFYLNCYLQAEADCTSKIKSMSSSRQSIAN